MFANNLTAATTAKVIAHELAHGAFRLAHSFPALPENGTNLMDYSATGTQLHKHQWDEIHNPEAMLGLFEEDGEGALVSTELGNDLAKDLLQLIRVANTKKLALTDISIYCDKKSTILDFAVDQLKLDLLHINVMAMSITAVDRTQNIKPSEISRETLSTWNGSSGDFIKYTFHKDGLIGPLVNSNNRSLEIIIKAKDIMKFENYLFLKDMIDGLERASIANRIDNADIRFYGRFGEGEGRLTDSYVDCAEFVYEVLTEQGFTGFPSGGCNDQSAWFKAKEKDGLCTTDTDVSKVIVGDIILWTSKGGSTSSYSHTGIVVEKSENTVSIVNAGFQQCYCDYKWKTYTKVDENKKIVQKYQTVEECYSDKCEKPSIWKSEGTNSEGYFKANTLSSEDHVFGYWARPSLVKK